MPNIEKLKKLSHYAIDKGSPRALLLDASTDTLDKIAHFEFPELEMTGQGVADMWQTFNVFAASYAQARPVPAAAQKKCKTGADLWAAACKAAEITPVPPLTAPPGLLIKP